MRCAMTMIHVALCTLCVAVGAGRALADTPRAEPKEARVIERTRKLRNEGKPAEAEAELDKFLKRNEKSALVLVELAGLLLEQKRYEAAAERYKKALAIAPEFGIAAKNLGRVEVALGKPEDAVKHLARGIELDGPDPDTVGALAYCYLQTDQPAQAESCYRLARSLRPERKDLALGLARALLDQEDWARCAAACQEAIQRWPDDNTGWMLLANARLGSEDDAHAVEALLALHYLGTQEKWVLPMTADLYLRLDVPRQAARLYAAASKRGDLSARRQVSAAQAMLGCSQTPQARALLQQALARKPPAETAARAHLLLGEAAEIDGDLGAAEKRFRSAIDLRPTYALAIRRLGDVLLKAERYTAALDTYRLLEAQDGHEGEALRGQADVHLRQCQWQKALDALYRLNDAAPSAYVATLIERVRQRVDSAH